MVLLEGGLKDILSGNPKGTSHALKPRTPHSAQTKNSTQCPTKNSTAQELVCPIINPTLPNNKPDVLLGGKGKPLLEPGPTQPARENLEEFLGEWGNPSGEIHAMLYQMNGALIHNRKTVGHNGYQNLVDRETRSQHGSTGHLCNVKTFCAIV